MGRTKDGTSERCLWGPGRGELLTDPTTTRVLQTDGLEARTELRPVQPGLLDSTQSPPCPECPPFPLCLSLNTRSPPPRGCIVKCSELVLVGGGLNDGPTLQSRICVLWSTPSVTRSDHVGVVGTGCGREAGSEEQKRCRHVGMGTGKGEVASLAETGG